MKLAKNWKWTCRAQGDFAQLLCAALALCWLTAPSLAGAVTVTLSASDDAWIDQGAKDANNGADTVLRVKSGTGATAKKHVLAKFDLSGIPAECATVTSAALHLVITTPPSGNRTHNLHRITATWAEGTLTWNNQPTFNGTAAASATASSGGGTVTWDVTSEVTAFLSGSAVNYGWLVKDSVDSTIAEVVYGSDENGTPSSRPQLEVIYTTSDVACDDSNPCTDDTCHETMGCQYAYNDDPCEDGLFCNGTDTCSGGSCGHSGDPCTGGLECNNVCNEGADNCAVTAGTPCTPDGNVCTDDECDGAGSCGVNNAAPCDDGEFCNGTDTCSGGTCGHSGNPCTSGPECNNDCNEEADNCVVAEGTPCSADTNECTDDECDGAGACAHPNNADPCDDGLFCNGTDTCSDGSCGHSGDPCTSGPECNNDCNEGADNCAVTAGTPCDDGRVCTANDACDGEGTCIGAGEPSPDCRTAAKSILLWKDTVNDTKDKLIWKWIKGEQTSQEEFGAAAELAQSTLCIYAGTPGAVVGEVVVPSDPVKWQPIGTKGYKYKDNGGAADGVQKIVLKGSTENKSKALVKGKGTNLPTPGLPWDLPVTAQLVNSETGICWEGVYNTDDVKKNREDQFKAKAQTR